MSKNKITLFYKNTLILTMLTVLLVACGGGEGGGPISESPNTELAVPKNIQFVEHDGKVFISWGSAKGALNYKLYLSKEQEIDLENIDEDVVSIYELEGTSTEISNLETNTPYFLAVASINGSQEKSFKLKKPVVLKSPPIDFDLSAPGNLEVTGLEGEIEINWEPLPEAFNYLIFFSSTDNQVDPSSAQQIQEVGAPPFRHKGLSPNKTYYYRISAITPLGLTPLSDVVSASVMAFTAPPQTPDRFSASVGDSLVALKWEPVHRATTYNVYMAKEPILSLTDIAELDGGEVFFNISNVSTNRLDLENDITYYFRISAVNTNGESGISKMVSGTPKSALPMVPSNISATSQRDGVKISWNEVVGAQGYYLYWFDQPNANKQTAYKSDRILENEFLDVNLTSQDTIYYFVTAGNDFGESEASAVVSVPVILPPAPVDVWVDAGLDKTTISWSPSSTEVKEYVLYLASETGIRKDNYYRLNNGKRLRNITNNEFEITRLLPDTQYYIAIASVNKGVEGGLSAELKFRTPVIEDVSTPPVISLIGSEQVSFIQGQEYIDLGATATDKEEGDLSDKIIVTHNVNSQIPGVYSVRYNVIDSTKLAAEEVVRQVTISAYNPPLMTLNYPFFITEKLPYGSSRVYLLVEDGIREEMLATDAGLELSLKTLKPGSYNVSIEVEFESDIYGSVILAFSNNIINISAGNNVLNFSASDYEYPDENLDDESNLDSLIAGVNPLGCAFDASLFGNCFWN